MRVVIRPKKINTRVLFFILTRDRLALFKETLFSALTSDNPEMEVVVSDNSTTAETETFMHENHPDIQYVRRSGQLGMFEHVSAALDDADSEFVVLFHDDDLVFSGFCKTLLASLDQYPKAVAAGCAAVVFHGQNRTDFIFGCPDAVIDNPNELLGRYLRIKRTEIHPPLPGYMYRKSVLGKTRPDDRQGRLAADVSFLHQAAQLGPLIFLSFRGIGYRFHASNFSNIAGIHDSLSLWRYARTASDFKKDSLVLSGARALAWKKWLAAADKTAIKSNKRYEVARRAVGVFDSLFQRWHQAQKIRQQALMINAATGHLTVRYALALADIACGLEDMGLLLPHRTRVLSDSWDLIDTTVKTLKQPHLTSEITQQSAIKLKEKTTITQMAVEGINNMRKTRGGQLPQTWLMDAADIHHHELGDCLQHATALKVLLVVACWDDVESEQSRKKLHALGWNCEAINGHSQLALFRWSNAQQNRNGPQALLCRVQLGYRSGGYLEGSHLPKRAFLDVPHTAMIRDWLERHEQSILLDDFL